jgi:hypothetical protein
VLLNEASAYPHGSIKLQSVRDGSIVLMDCGCTVHGYQSDISRTWVFGEPSARQRKVWNTVKRGQEIALETAKLGVVAGGKLDDAVRGYYEREGWGPGYRLPGTVASHRTRHRPGRTRAGLPGARRCDAAAGRHVLLRRTGTLHSRGVRRAPGGLLGHDRRRSQDLSRLSPDPWKIRFDRARIAADLALSVLCARPILAVGSRTAAATPRNFPRVDIVVPARDEAPPFAPVIASLLAQDYRGEFRVILVDDNSSDGTARTRGQRRRGSRSCSLTSKPRGMVRQTMGVEPGRRRRATRRCAVHGCRHRARAAAPIVAGRKAAAAARGHGQRDGALELHEPGRTRLVPAFVYFFQMLYPFARVNDPGRALRPLRRRHGAHPPRGAGADRRNRCDQECAHRRRERWRRR